MRYYMPGAPSAETEIARQSINEALARDGISIDYQPLYIPWDQWVNKINIMLSTGEEFELFHIMEDYVPLATYVSRKSLTPITDILPKAAPSLKSRFDNVYWLSAAVDNQIYAVPAVWFDQEGEADVGIRIRKDKFDRYGIPIPKTPAEIVTALAALQEKWAAEDGKKRYFYEHTLNRPSVPLHRSYDTWPYYVSLDGLFQIRQDGTANLYYETAEFKKDTEFMNTLYRRGLIHPDILSLPIDTSNAAKTDGDILMGFNTGPRTSYELLSRGIKEADVLVYYLNPPPEKPILTIMPVLNLNAIPVTAKHPEAALKFLDWVYKNQDNQDLVLYGVKGRHWNPIGKDKYELIRGSNGNPLYLFDFWMIEDVRGHRWDAADQSTDYEKRDYVENMYPESTVISPKVGFNFNPEPVRVEYANMIAEYTASIIPIKAGVVPYEGSYDAALAKMRAAGSERVIAEYRRQLARHMANVKK
jgi:putative aldouronate transport system substrate-binding protein